MFMYNGYYYNNAKIIHSNCPIYDVFYCLLKPLDPPPEISKRRICETSFAGFARGM